MLTVAPFQYTALKNIDLIEPLNDGDIECLVEIRDALKRHGKLDRFCVALAHNHFDLADDEIMLETVDEVNRTLITKATKLSDAGPSTVGTLWALQDGDINTMSWCRKYCHSGIFGHSKEHNTVPGQ